MTAPDSPLADPALTVAVALATGALAQAAARHLRLPGIVLLLATGFLLGPDLLDLVRPDTLGGALQALVGFAVAIILFEGGLNLDLARLRREARSIRQLVTVGAVITAGGGAVTARLLLDWSWTVSILFGSLVIVTGPTVVTPLLRRLRLRRSISTVLEAEGVLVDAIGAVIAVVTLEVLIRPLDEAYPEGLWELVSRLGFGFLAGLAAGAVIVLLLRFDPLLPEGLENITILSLVLAFFQASNALLPESGIVTATVAGIAVGNARTHRLRDLKDFKEQLTVMMIGLLFVLLAADVRMAELRSLGWPGVWTVVALMVVVRPLNVLVGTAGSDLKAREKAFLAWLAPRGIVAAAVSSLFAQELDKAGIPGGNELRALVFLVIAGTVVVQGLTGGLVADLLGVRRRGSSGWALLGVNPVSLAVAAALRDEGEEVVFLDSNPAACAAAEQDGYRVLFGNALSESLLTRAEMDDRTGAIGLTANEELNFLFARRAREEYKVGSIWLAQRAGDSRVTAPMLERFGARPLFGPPHDVARWAHRLERGRAAAERWELRTPPDGRRGDDDAVPEALLPLVVASGRGVSPWEAGRAPSPGDRLHLLVAEEGRAEAESWLAERGWQKPSPADEAPSGDGRNGPRGA